MELRQEAVTSFERCLSHLELRKEPHLYIQKPRLCNYIVCPTYCCMNIRLASVEDFSTFVYENETKIL